MKLTPFGREVRGLRMDTGRMMKDMADHLHVSESYVSAVEFGKRAIPETWPMQIAAFFGLGKEKSEGLQVLAKGSNKVLSIDLQDDSLSQLHRETAAIFAMSLPKFSEEQLLRVKRHLEEIRHEKPWARGSSVAVDGS